MRYLPTCLGIALLSIPVVALSGENAYVCEVVHIYHVNGEGALQTTPVMEKIAQEHTFTVSRNTGALTGENTDMDTSLAKHIQVISPGSKDNSFVAIADYGVFPNGTHPYQLIEVQEFVVGLSKPFILKGGLGVTTGFCK
jgi:hypothetical protein